MISDALHDAAFAIRIYLEDEAYAADRAEILDLLAAMDRMRVKLDASPATASRDAPSAPKIRPTHAPNGTKH